MAKERKHTNRLIHESSPYLQQHAHNPVDWFPWGEGAFEAAQSQDKPIFLSIGYSTCHWCHVMEREVFEDEEIAALMNHTFVNIKVDREELPHVDSLYMEFAQSMMAGTAGWPLNLILTPDLKPFYAATYVPAHSKQGVMGMKELVPQMQALWSSEERAHVVDQAGQIVEAFKSQEEVFLAGLPLEEVIEAAGEILFKLMDPVHGGLAGTPKFPIGYQSGFFLRYLRHFRDSRALFCAERTLSMISYGGIHDHIGGGFARYSVDESWEIPHFEKMLYDNALLSDAYLEAWQLTNRQYYREMSQRILDYLIRDMCHEEGGFFSAEDAESGDREGVFYSWTPGEIAEVLGEREAQLFCEYYHISPQGNFEGRNVPHIKAEIEEFAKSKELDAQELKQLFEEYRQRLFQARSEREHPAIDDKVLCAWNGLALHALSTAGRSFDRVDYVEQAEKNARFIKENLWKDGVLYRRWREGDRACHACLEDYAFLIRGLLVHYESTGKVEWLKWAVELAAVLDRDYGEPYGAFHVTDGKDPHILIRQTRYSDGAEPSGNAVHTENLIKLFQFTGDEKYVKRAENCLSAAKGRIESYPPSYIYHLIALQRFYDKKAPTIVVAFNEEEEYRDQLQRLLFHPFMPNKVVIWRREGDEELFDLIPMVREQKAREGKTTLYICRKGVCEEPYNRLSDMIAAIHSL